MIALFLVVGEILRISHVWCRHFLEKSLLYFLFTDTLLQLCSVSEKWVLQGNSIHGSPHCKKPHTWEKWCGAILRSTYFTILKMTTIQILCWKWCRCQKITNMFAQYFINFKLSSILASKRWNHKGWSRTDIGLPVLEICEYSNQGRSQRWIRGDFWGFDGKNWLCIGICNL